MDRDILSCRIQGSALTYGFPSLSVAALRTVSCLDRREDAHQCRVMIHQLLDCCDRVKCPPIKAQGIQSLQALKGPILRATG